MGRKKEIKLITLDTETYNGLIGGLKRIAIYDGVKVHYGYKFSDIEPILIQYSRKFDIHIYIHNIEFDARKIPEIFDKSRIEWDKSFIINGKLATIKNKKWTFHDSFKLLPMGLKSLSEDFNVSHGKLDLVDEVLQVYGDEYIILDKYGDIDRNATLVNFLDKCHVDDEVYLKYLGYDVISLYEVLQELIKVSGISVNDFVKRISTASLSRFIFKNGFKGKEFKNPFGGKTDYQVMCQYNYKWNLEVEEFLRDSYCGGRTEVFKIFAENVKHYDVNSLYPYVMVKGEFPVGKPDFIKNSRLAKVSFEEWLETKKGIGFLYCQVFIPKQNIPPLPCKMGKLAFPCGRVYGVWNYEELDYAIKECGVVIEEYYESVFYHQTYPIFERFINTMLEIKDEGTRTGNTALRTFGKLLMNVGYGYTGMRRDDKTSLKDFDEREKYIDDIVFADPELGYIEIPTEIRAEYIQVAVASTVTARARLELLKALKYCDERGNVYYCDTDSIVTDVELPENWCDSIEIGKWDLESEPIKALFLRPKVYSEIVEKKGEIKTNIKFKGISRETQKDLDFETYESLLHEMVLDDKEEIIIEKNKTTFRSIMYMKKKGLADDYYETRDKKINLKTTQKRIMLYKENKTVPYYFETASDFKNFNFSNYNKEVLFSMTGD